MMRFKLIIAAFTVILVIQLAPRALGRPSMQEPEVEHSGTAGSQTDHRKYLDKLDIISIMGQQPLPLQVKLVMDDDDNDSMTTTPTTTTQTQKTQDLLNTAKKSSKLETTSDKLRKKKQKFLEYKIIK